MDVVLLLMVLGVMVSGFWAADALDHMREEIIRQEGKRRGKRSGGTVGVGS